MRSRSTCTHSILLFSLVLTGCSSVIPLHRDSGADAPSTPSDQTVVDAPVLDTLVTDAARISEEEAAQPTPVQEQDTAPAVEESAETTIPMTPNRVVERTINNYLQNRRNLLEIWAERSRVYFPMISQIFSEEGVPDELKYLALGESGLNPTIRSHAGAVGMWQFMAGTARSEGLRVDSWVDERRDPELATRAAAKHIKALNADYGGRWHLTMAGYNCSYRCITRAVRRAGYTMDDPPTYWDVYARLPRETRDFVPKFIAIALIMSNPDLYGLDVQDLGEELAYDVVQVKGMLSLEDAARLAGTDEATIHKLNPALLRSTLPDDEQAYALKIPLGSYDRFVANFHASAPQAVAGKGIYVVRKGDTLGKIAHEYDTSVKELQALNGIKGHIININQKLAIPAQAGNGKLELVSSERVSVDYGTGGWQPIKLPEGFQLVHQSGAGKDQPLLAVSLNQNMVEADEGAMSLVPTIYRVKSGDTLAAIAKQFGVSVASIQAANNIKGYLIYPKQELTIHSATNIADPPQPGTLTYEVQKGDNLYVIARRFGMTVDNLKKLNGLRSNLIHPGLNLVVN